MASSSLIDDSNKNVTPAIRPAGQRLDGWARSAGSEPQTGRDGRRRWPLFGRVFFCVMFLLEPLFDLVNFIFVSIVIYQNVEKKNPKIISVVVEVNSKYKCDTGVSVFVNTQTGWNGA
ncbi:hypothetical protein BpHYR1_031980 [Brachionus plicatilis]|uniref:Uncharacterized protein n=1 Tax=Brachionus plicatilis TaxID=10195 RepID=A0A3M7ST27_BRAPC|nr:hypothetical protein BpHYR1_031980 [Brachionus plicatilis]